MSATELRVESENKENEGGPIQSRETSEELGRVSTVETDALFVEEDRAAIEKARLEGYDIQLPRNTRLVKREHLPAWLARTDLKETTIISSQVLDAEATGEKQEVHFHSRDYQPTVTPCPPPSPVVVPPPPPVYYPPPPAASPPQAPLRHYHQPSYSRLPQRQLAEDAKFTVLTPTLSIGDVLIRLESTPEKCEAELDCHQLDGRDEDVVVPPSHMTFPLHPLTTDEMGSTFGSPRLTATPTPHRSSMILEDPQVIKRVKRVRAVPRTEKKSSRGFRLFACCGAA